jgi:hypothetical protein
MLVASSRETLPNFSSSLLQGVGTSSPDTSINHRLPIPSTMTHLRTLLPFIKRPLIVVPPMAFVTKSRLTIATAQAGPPLLGTNPRCTRFPRMWYPSPSPQVTSGYDVPSFENDLSLVLSALRSLEIPHVKSGFLPFGVGFQIFATPIEVLDTVFPGDGVTPHPSAAWLFVGDFATWIHRIRAKSPETVIFAQISSVEVFPTRQLMAGRAWRC